MLLLELNASFLKWKNDSLFERVSNLKEADGLIFLCPKCFITNNKSSIGVHSIICWEPNVPQSTQPTPGRWNLVGTSLEDVTLIAGSSSVGLTGEGCKAHFYIRNGRIEDGNW